MYILWVVLTFSIPSFAQYSYEEVEKLVIRGVDVDIEQYPYTAQIVRMGMLICGGSVISDRTILTAAHCLVDDDELLNAKDLSVFLGSDRKLTGKRYQVCRVVAHEGYGNEEFGYFYDIGLMSLIKNIKFGPTVQKAIIAPHTKWRNTKNSMTIAGFGRIDNINEGAERLLVTRLTYVNPRLCSVAQTGDGEKMLVNKHMFCMVSDSTWTSDCNGDSGSPVTWRQYVVGVVSIGRDYSCGSEMMPSMYTDVTSFRDWIYSNIMELESQPLNACKDLISNDNRAQRYQDDEDCIEK